MDWLLFALLTIILIRQQRIATGLRPELTALKKSLKTQIAGLDDRLKEL